MINVKWNEEAKLQSNKKDTSYFSLTFNIDGDTIVEGRPCFKTKNKEYAYESEGKVYWYRKDKWELMFDFSLKVGEKFCPDKSMEEVEYLTVSSIDTIQVNGKYYRRYHFAEMLNPLDGWVEGIGNMVSGPYFYPFMPSFSYQWFACLSVYDGDECIFTKDDFTKEAYHSEPVGINVMDVSNASAPLYDLYGRRLQGEPRKGIYVKGGRKFLRK